MLDGHALMCQEKIERPHGRFERLEPQL